MKYSSPTVALTLKKTKKTVPLQQEITLPTSFELPRGLEAKSEADFLFPVTRFTVRSGLLFVIGEEKLVRLVARAIER